LGVLLLHNQLIRPANAVVDPKLGLKDPTDESTIDC